MKSPAFLLALLLPALATTLSAQREISIRALAFQPGFPSELHAHNPSGSSTAGPVEVKSFLNHESSTLKLEGDSVAFTRKSSPASATNVDDVLCKVDLPATKSAIVLFTSGENPKQPAHCRARAIDDSVQAFPAGSFLVVNFTKTPVKITLEEKSYEIAPDAAEAIAKIPYTARQSVRMQAFAKKGDAWNLISTGTWTNPGTRRVLEVLTQDPATGQVEMRGIRDVATK